jgi:hypothetical protein
MRGDAHRYCVTASQLLWKPGLPVHNQCEGTGPIPASEARSLGRYDRGYGPQHLFARQQKRNGLKA